MCVVRVGCRGGGDTSNSKAQLRNTQQHTALKHTHTFFLFVVFSVGGYKGCFFGWRFWGVSGSDIEGRFGGGIVGWFGGGIEGRFLVSSARGLFGVKIGWLGCLESGCGEGDFKKTRVLGSRRLYNRSEEFLCRVIAPTPKPLSERKFSRGLKMAVLGSFLRGRF